MLLCISVDFWRRLHRELRNVGRPLRLRRVALLIDALDAVADHCAAVRSYRTLHHSLVIVDEQPGGREDLGPFFHQVELDCSRNRVSRATAELPLVIHLLWTPRVKVDHSRWSSKVYERCGIEMVALVRKIRNPSIALNRVGHFLPPLDRNVCETDLSQLHSIKRCLSKTRQSTDISIPKAPFRKLPSGNGSN